MLKFLEQYFKKEYKLINLALLVIGISFSFWLMFKTFSYQDGTMQIASKVWSDFASHIPLIRSFSFGLNIPPEFPIFPGSPIKYHFLFYYLVGSLEKIGIPIDFALNIPSALGFFFLIFMIYHFAKLLFSSKLVALLSVIFFLFNGTLSFIYFFTKHQFRSDISKTIIENKDFASFHPYAQDGNLVSAFWSLNIYTNQRHLAAAYGLSLLVLYILLKPYFLNHKVNLLLVFLISLVLGQSYFFHLPVLVMTLMILSMLLLFFKKLRVPIFLTIFITTLMSIPQYLYTKSPDPGLKPSFNPGYLISDNLTFTKFLYYWWLNLGLHSVLAPIGFILASKKAKAVFLSFLPLFIIGNLFQFSPEIAANHKFFNFFIIIAGIFSASVIINLFKQSYPYKLFALILVFLLTFSGFIDFFPVKNDFQYNIPDYPRNSDINWIKNNTPKDAIFLNTNFFYEPSSLAGRKIFNGWSYFAWSAGYDTFKRDPIYKSLLYPTDLNLFCTLLKQNRLSYLSLNTQNIYPELEVNKEFFDSNFPIVYQNSETSTYIYELFNTCLSKKT